MGQARKRPLSDRAKAIAADNKKRLQKWRGKVADRTADPYDHEASRFIRVPYSILRAGVEGPVTPEMLALFYYVVGHTGIAETENTFEYPGAVFPGIALLSPTRWSPEYEKKRQPRTVTHGNKTYRADVHALTSKRLFRAVAAWEKRADKCFLTLPNGEKMPFFQKINWYRSRPGDEVERLKLKTDKQGRMLAVAVDERLLSEIRAYWHGYARFSQHYLLEFDRLPEARFRTLMAMHTQHRWRYNRCYSYTVEQLAAICGLQRSRRDVLLGILDRFFRSYEDDNKQIFQWAPARAPTGKLTHYEIELVNPPSNLWIHGFDLHNVHFNAKRLGKKEGSYTSVMPPRWSQYLLRQTRRWRRRAVDEPERHKLDQKIEMLEELLKLPWTEKEQRGVTSAKAIADLIRAQQKTADEEKSIADYHAWSAELEQVDFEAVAIETLAHRRELWRAENARRALDGWSAPDITLTRDALDEIMADNDVDILDAILALPQQPENVIPSYLNEAVIGAENGIFGLDDLLENFVELLTPDELAFIGEHYGLTE